MTEMIQPQLSKADRAIGSAIARGAARRCPSCGEGQMFDGFLTVRDACGSCREELRHHRADDLPAFLSILLSGKIMVALLVFSETTAPLGDAGTYVWPILALVMTLCVISPMKGAVVGVQWANRMHGFGDEAETHTDPSTDTDVSRTA